MLKCPYCKHEIKYLDYQVTFISYTVELGVYYPEKNSYETTEEDERDREYNNDYIYHCPHCETEITLLELEEQKKEKDLNLTNLSKKYEVLSHSKTK